LRYLTIVKEFREMPCDRSYYLQQKMKTLVLDISCCYIFKYAQAHVS